MSKAWLVLLAGCAACHGNTDIVVAVPDDVVYVAGLNVEGDALVDATPLSRWRTGEGFSLFFDGEREHAIVGFTAEQLPFEDGDNRPFTEPLVSPDAICAQELPAPTWSMDANGTAVDPSTLPDLTAPWVQSWCAPLDLERLVVENLCTGRRCDPIEVSTTPCGGVFSLSGCDGPEIDLEKQGDGALCISSDTADLETCRYILHEREQSPPPFELTRRQLIADRDVRLLQRPKPQDRRNGSVLDFVFIANRVVVIVNPEPGRACDDPNAERRLVVLDETNFDPQGEVPVAPCTERLLVSNDRILAPVDVAGAWMLGVFDANGVRTATVSFGGPALDAAAYRAVELIEIDDMIVVAFGVDRTARPDLFGLVIITLDRDTLAPRSRVTTNQPEETWTVIRRGDRLIASGVGQQSFFEIDPDDGNIAETPIPHVYPGAEMNDLYIDDDKVVVSLRQALHLFGNDEAVRRPVLSQADVIAVHAWTDEHLLVAELEEHVGPPRQTFLLLYDRAANRFTTAHWPIGPSIVGRIRTDDRGRIVILMPWTGEIIRVTPR